MESITRPVRELKPDERRIYEAALGKQLHENQQIILQVITVVEPSVAADAAQSDAAGPRPDWCNVYEGLTEHQVAEVESAVLNRDSWQ